MPETPYRDSIPFYDLLTQRLSRRRFIEAGVTLAPLALGACAIPEAAAVQPAIANGLRFQRIVGSTADAIVLPPGYTFDVVARWGDSLSPRVPDLDTAKLAGGILLQPEAAEHQNGQFGTNCDAIHFFPLNARADRGILCVNNEYTDDALMYGGHPGLGGATSKVRDFVRTNPQAVAVSKAAQGVSVIEIARQQGRWSLVKDSRFNRRITAETLIDVSGPARGAALLKTRGDASGTRVRGTFANCAGGETPWGTYLTTEENIQDYFGNLAALRARTDVDPFIVDAHRRFRMWNNASLYGWEGTDPRFDLAQEPCEPFRFGWIVEIDPRDPQRAPVKRTALGRFAHEGASPVIAPDGRIAVYLGDDDKFEYIYKFVSTAKFDARNPAANRDLLDRGTLYAARFDASGAGHWLPLVHDPKGPLNAAAGFRDQADVLIKARAAAHLLGATPMDRTEDVEANPRTGRIYAACTRNEQRTANSAIKTYAGHDIDFGPDAANPRGANPWGHIIEMREAGDDHTAMEFSWEVFLLAGDPSGNRLVTDLKDLRPGQVDPNSTYFAGYPHAADLSPIGSPDNVGFDPDGNLWIVTDGDQPTGANNGCWACPTSGPTRGRLQQFMSGPKGAEICGCQFTPDGETLFLSIQHPGEGGTIANPRSHWPDGPGTQPRSTVIAVRKEGGGKVGT
jgi:secreted PhoX family phosphatase